MGAILRKPLTNKTTSSFLKNSFLLSPEEQSIDGLISSTYGTNFHNNSEKEQWEKCMILTTRNKDAQKATNDIMTDKIPGYTRMYKSADSTGMDNPGNTILPDEFLNSLNPSGLPPHELKLKVGIPIILIRSIAPKSGLYNGARLRIDSLDRYVLTATILTGICIGQQVKIPRIDFYFRQPLLPFTLIRCQFPILVAFAITINQSQGQGFDHVGIYLPSPVFSHGQLYVALSRCKSIKNLKILIEHNPKDHKHTKNVVYQEALNI